MAASAVHVERESKLAPGPDFELSDVARLIDQPRTVEVLPSLDLEAAYFDAPNFVLARSGITVRHRTGDGAPTWTVKLPVGSAANELARIELEVEGPRNRRPREVGAAVAALLRGRRLVAVAELHTIRSRVEVSDGAGRRLVQVCHDLVTAVRGRDCLGSWEEVEIEALEPYEGVALQHELAKALRRAGAKKVRGMPKLVRAVGEEASAPPEVVVRPLPEPPTVAATVERALARSVDQILRHDPAVRIGSDPEDLHQLRVAVRRLRSDLHTFRRLVGPDRATQLRTELAWVADQTNAWRDRDVLRAWLVAHRAAVPEVDAPGVDDLLARCDGEADAERARALRAMSSSRYLALVHELVDLVAEPPAAGRRAERDARAHLDRQVAKRWDQLAVLVQGLGPSPTPEELHQARIAAKRARAAVEAVVPIEGRGARRLGKALARLQDVLGAVHDATVFEAWLREAGASVAGFAAGELAALARAEGDADASAWPQAWAKAQRRHAQR